MPAEQYRAIATGYDKTAVPSQGMLDLDTLLRHRADRPQPVISSAA